MTAPGLPLLGDHARFVRRHLALIGVFIALGLLAGFAVSLRPATTYSSTVSVMMVPVPMYVTDPVTQLAPPAVSIDTDAQLLLSPTVLDAIGDALDVGRAAAADHLSVTASSSTSVLHITVTDTSPQRAADAANAAASALAVARRASYGALRDDQVRQLRILLDDDEEQLTRAQSRRVVILDDSDLFTEVQTLRDALDEIEEARDEPTRMVRPATAPRRPDYANTEVPLTSGAMLGLLLGCLVGAAHDHTRRRSARTAARTAQPASRRRPDAVTVHEVSHAV